MTTNHPQKAYFDKSWKVTEGVENLGFEFGEDREYRTAVDPVAKLSGIRGRRGNPTIKQMAYSNAVGLAVQQTDQVWTIWESTFTADIMPMHGDIILVNAVKNKFGDLVDPLTVAERWIVQWSKLALYGAQFVCYCSQSPLNQDAIY